MNIKPGVKTSELWVTVAVSLCGLLLTFGVINAEQSAAIMAFATAVIAVAPPLYYLWTRHSLKTTAQYSTLEQLTGNVEAVTFPDVDIIEED